MALQVGKTSFEKGQLHFVTLTLEDRFGTLSEGVKRRLEALSQAELDTLARTVWRAASLQELRLVDPPPTPTPEQ